MKIIAALFALVVLSQALYLPTHVQFLNYLEDHNKKYKSDEEFFYRFSVFQDNLKMIDELNQNSTGAVYGVTVFSDLTQQEFVELYLMKNLPVHEPIEELEVPENIEAPATFDWRSQAAVSAVKNQGQCGSCWAFSAVENIESVWKLAGHPMTLLSEQQVVDCDKDCYGCGGGWPYRAMNYIVQAGGIDTESTYPYTARNGACRFNPGNVGAKIKSYKSIPKNEASIRDSLTTTSPFSICVDANKWSSYRSGVMRSTQCGKSIDHCVQLVGYDSTASVPFWIVRNSWGTGWGISGYIQLEMNKDTCAMSQEVTTAVA
jgi:cathepsin F/cysteine peptidase B